MRKLLVGAALVVAACVVQKPHPPAPAPAPAPVPSPAPPATQRLTVWLTDRGDGAPIVDATVWAGDQGEAAGHSNRDGWLELLGLPPRANVQLTIVADHYVRFDGRVDVPATKDLHLTLTGTLPRPPTRDEALSVRMTFQGLTCHTEQFGDLPWFDAALFSLTLADRQRIYDCKHAAGDTHAIIGYDHNRGSIYDEDGQVYQRMLGPGFQDRPSEFLDAVKEVRRAGFVPLVFLGGDDGERGFLVAREALPQLIAVLRSAPERDLNRDVVILPGWDGVFYGYTPEHIAELGRLFRSLSPTGFLGIEHNTGRFPVGGGPGDWSATGPMSTYDLVMSEFDFPVSPSLSHDRNVFDDEHKLWTSPFEMAMGNVWQIAARSLGPAYRRPADQPADNDAGGESKWYLRTGSDRGKTYACAFEWVGEYLWVRWKQTAAQIAHDRAYLMGLGYSCGG